MVVLTETWRRFVRAKEANKTANFYRRWGITFLNFKFTTDFWTLFLSTGSTPLCMDEARRGAFSFDLLTFFSFYNTVSRFSQSLFGQNHCLVPCNLQPPRRDYIPTHSQFPTDAPTAAAAQSFLQGYVWQNNWQGSMITNIRITVNVLSGCLKKSYIQIKTLLLLFPLNFHILCKFQQKSQH